MHTKSAESWGYIPSILRIGTAKYRKPTGKCGGKHGGGVTVIGNNFRIQCETILSELQGIREIGDRRADILLMYELQRKCKETRGLDSGCK